MASPTERIRQALGPDQAARFDRFMVRLADRVEEIVRDGETSIPAFGLKFHKGEYLEAKWNGDVTIT